MRSNLGELEPSPDYHAYSGPGERLPSAINYQDLMRVYTQDLQIVEINKDLIERKNKEKFWARNSPLIRSCLFPESRFSG